MATDDPHVAVTGAAGYIGSRIVRQLQRDYPDWGITALDNFYLGDVRSVAETDVQHVDIRDRRQLETALSGADVVLHLAALSGVDDCDENADLAYEVNVQGTNNVAWFCRKHGVALTFPYSMAVVGDPVEFPITVDHPRDPLNWYGRTKLLGERAIDAYADGAFPAHQFMISNLYGDHRIGDRRVSKGTVINFFLDRALGGEPLTVYEPGTQSRNYVHVKDVADAFCRSAGALLDALESDETGSTAIEIASDEDLSVRHVAELVQSAAADIAGIDVDVELVENPRGNETLVDSFPVDTSRAQQLLDWRPSESVEATVRDEIERRTD